MDVLSYISSLSPSTIVGDYFFILPSALSVSLVALLGIVIAFRIVGK